MRKLYMCLAFFIATSSLCCSEAAEDDLTRLSQGPSIGLSARISNYVHEHAWCMAALSAALSYIAVKAFLDGLRPDPYEGPLREAHERIAELEAALVKFDQIYRVLGPVFKMRG